MQQIYKRTSMPKCDSTKLQSNFIDEYLNFIFYDMLT